MGRYHFHFTDKETDNEKPSNFSGQEEVDGAKFKSLNLMPCTPIQYIEEVFEGFISIGLFPLSEIRHVKTLAFIFSSCK